MKRATCLLAAILFLWSTTLCAYSSTQLDFKKTYAVIIGVLEWQDKSIGSFSKKERKDEELYNLLIAREVPRQNIILLLDSKATGSNMEKSIRDISGKAPPGSTFLFYYAGHGIRESDNSTYFANYDMISGKAGTTAFDMSKIARILKESFRGDFVILLADCCYSGGLLREAGKLSKERVNVVCLTASSYSNLSTGSWVFTQTIIDGLKGEPLADHNYDSRVTLKEIGEEITSAMKYRTRQVAGVYVPPPDEDIVLSNLDPGNALKPEAEIGPGTKPSGPYKTGEYVFGFYDSRWNPARVVGFHDGSYTVQFYFYSEKKNVDLTADKLKVMTFITYPVKEKVVVTWEGTKYDAEIVKVKDDFHWITYSGWSSYWDEWVPYDRIVSRKGETTRKAQVEEEGKWYPAVVLMQKNGRYFIHYDGYDNSWDEWVTQERIRFE